MRTIAIMNNKGGVGKTVTSINLADILVRDHHKKVVVVDCDGQANLTRFFLTVDNANPDSWVTTADVLTGECEPVWSDNLIPIRDGLEILPSSSGLYDLDLQAIKDGDSAPENMKHFALAAREDDETDFMIFDCPPGYTVASVAALLAADEVVIPVTADAFSIDGVGAVLRQVRTIRRTRPGLTATALLTQVHSADVVTEGEKLLRNMGVSVFETRIRRTDKVPESTMSLTPLAEYSAGSAATREYRAWVRELLGEV